jgi:parallel beta-helix repeat protein
MIIPIYKPEKPRIVSTRSKVGFSVCLMVMVVILMAHASLEPRAGSTREFHPSKPLQSYDPAIFVNNNTDLAAIADHGNGTAGNPYVITNKTILGAYESACIRIQNTNTHLRILNCTTTHSTRQNIGISLRNCTNVELAGNNASHSTNGIFIDSCNRINISGNFVTLNSYGIYIIDSSNFSCVDNVIFNLKLLYLSALSIG